MPMLKVIAVNTLSPAVAGLSVRMLPFLLVLCGAQIWPLALAAETMDWEEWKAPVVSELENWKERKFLQHRSASFEPVVKVYRQASDVVSQQPLGSRPVDGLRAHLDLLHDLSFQLPPLPQEEYSGYSLSAAYSEALSIWAELKRRGQYQPEDAQRVVEMAIGVREFDTAIMLNESEGLAFNLPEGVDGDSNSIDPQSFRVWRLTDRNQLKSEQFEFPEGLHWVVSSMEGCGFFRRMLADVSDQSTLRALLDGRLTWLIPPVAMLDLGLVELTNEQGVEVEPIWMHTTEDWSMLGSLISSPAITLMRGEESLHHWVGWPQNGGHLAEMLAAWEKHE